MNRKSLTFTFVALTVGATLGAAGCSATNSANGTGADTTARATTSDHVEPGQPPTRGPNPYEYLPKVPSFTLTSQTVGNGRPLPTPQLSGILKVPGGKDISPQLSWSGFPATTKSFVVSMYDPQAPTGSGFWHWVVADIPATTTSLPENVGTLNSTALPAGAFQLDGDAGAARYTGAAPPSGSGVHDYYLTITALDIARSGLTSTSSGALLGFTIGGHTIARATLICPTTAK